MPYSLAFFFLSLAAIFFGDIFTSSNNPQIGFFVTLFVPLLLFLLAKIEKKKIHIPIRETIFYLLFIVFSIVSTALAIDKEIAIQTLLIYISGYFFFVFAFNYQKELGKYFQWFLVTISLFSSLLLLINKIHPLNLFQEGASLFYNGYYHNEAGNLIILGIVVCLYLALFKKKNILLILLSFFLPFFIFSYSRSAYLALIVVGAIFFSTKKNWLLAILILLLTSLFFVTTKEVRNFLPNSIDHFLTNRLFIPKEKSLLGKRPQHLCYTLLSIKDRPFFGVGPGNLYLSTARYQFNQEEETTSAHNIFLDIVAENGSLAGIAFILFLISTLILMRTRKGLYFYLFLSLSLIFLFDFSYRFLVFFVLWMSLLGLLPDKEDQIRSQAKLVILAAVLLLISGEIIFVGNGFLYSGRPDLSIIIDPFYNEAHTQIIEMNIRKKEMNKAKENLINYDFFFENGFVANLRKGYFYEELGDKKQAIYFYEKATYVRPILIKDLFTKVMDLNVSLYDQQKGGEELKEFIQRFKKNNLIPKGSDVEKIIKDFCLDYNLKC